MSTPPISVSGERRVIAAVYAGLKVAEEALLTGRKDVKYVAGYLHGMREGIEIDAPWLGTEALDSRLGREEKRA